MKIISCEIIKIICEYKMNTKTGHISQVEMMEKYSYVENYRNSMCELKS